MHPFLKSRTNTLLYLSAWIPLGVMLSLLLVTSARMPVRESAAVAIPLTLQLAIICLAPWHACRSMPIGGTHIFKLLFSHLLAASVASAIFLLVAKLLVSGLYGFFPRLSERFQPALPLIAAMAALMYILSIAFHYAVLAVESSRKAEVLAREAELKALKAQVNPHFLFNSLNSISALTTVDAARARDMCIRLSDFLRISLRLGERGTISFAEELELARTYLDVEQVRFGKRLRVVEQLDKACDDCDVPPLLVQPLVENAIKHGIATLVEGGEILISAARSAGAMRFVIENPFDPEAPAATRSGIGLRNVRERLHARYGASAQIEVSAVKNVFRVSLFFPYGRYTA